MEVERSALGGEQNQDRRGTPETQNTAQGHTDSLRRDSTGTITADCPSFYQGVPLEQGQAHSFFPFAFTKKKKENPGLADSF